MMTLKQVSDAYVLRVLKDLDGNRTHSAKALGISRRSLNRKILDFAASGVSVPEPKRKHWLKLKRERQ